MGLFAAGQHAVPQGFVINNVVAAHQARQVEGLAGGVEGHGALARVLADRLGGGMLVAVEQDVGPDFVGDDGHIIGAVDFHRALDLPALPHTAAGVVGGAEDGRMDVVLLQQAVHVVKIHPPHAVFVPVQGAVDDAVAIGFQRAGKADVGGAVDQHGIAGGGQAAQGRHYAAQNTVFVADGLFGQVGHAVAVSLPVGDSLVVGVRRGKVAVQRVLSAFNDGGRDRGHGGKVHVRDPHGDDGKAVLRLARCKAARLAQGIHRQRIHPAAVVHSGKIVFHDRSPLLHVFA